MFQNSSEKIFTFRDGVSQFHTCIYSVVVTFEDALAYTRILTQASLLLHYGTFHVYILVAVKRNSGNNNVKTSVDANAISSEAVYDTPYCTDETRLAYGAHSTFRALNCDS